MKHRPNPFDTSRLGALLRARPGLLALSVALAALIGLAPVTRAQAVRQLVTQSIDERQSFEVGGSTRPEANADNDLGPVADDLLLEHIELLLQRPPETEAALTELIDRLHDPKSPDFHQWLDNQRLRDEFGPAESDVDTVTGWLSSHGMTVHGVRQNGMVIDFSGTAAQVRDTFRTEIHLLAVRGATRIANMSNPKIPAALAGVVKGIVSLNDFPAQPQLTVSPQYTTSPYTTSILGLPGYALVPGDLWAIYNFNPLLKAGITGKGQTITVVEDRTCTTRRTGRHSARPSACPATRRRRSRRCTRRRPAAQQLLESRGHRRCGRSHARYGVGERSRAGCGHRAGIVQGIEHHLRLSDCDAKSGRCRQIAGDRQHELRHVRSPAGSDREWCLDHRIQEWNRQGHVLLRLLR